MKTVFSNNRVKIRGKIVEGLRVAADFTPLEIPAGFNAPLEFLTGFTQISWVRKQFISKLSIDPYPGTLNLEIVDPESLQTFRKLKAMKGIEITPEDLNNRRGGDKYVPCPLLVNMVSAGYLGRKSGRGFYEYTHR